MSFRKRVASFLCAACMLVSILSVSRPAMVYAGSLDDQLQEARDAQAELEKQKMSDDVKKEIVSVAALMAGKVVAASIDTTVQNQLIDETLKEIGEKTWLN